MLVTFITDMGLLPPYICKNISAMRTKRSIISIDENLCNGCGACAQGCNEGALQIIDGKARMVSDLYCDGLGACIGDCPTGAIKIEEREAEPYNEEAVMERISKNGEHTILAHLNHLKTHGEMALLQQGITYIKQHNLKVDISTLTDEQPALACGCKSSMTRSFEKPNQPNHYACVGTAQSELTHWPIQLHLINPASQHFSNADLLLAADCTAFALGSFHSNLLRNHKLAIACPKLDSNKEQYIDKLTALFDNSDINTLTVVIMEVSCCRGLLQLAQVATQKASRKTPIKRVVIGVQGNIIDESWI